MRRKSREAASVAAQRQPAQKTHSSAPARRPVLALGLALSLLPAGSSLEPCPLGLRDIFAGSCRCSLPFLGGERKKKR